MKYLKFILILTFLALILLSRFWKLGELPYGTHVDEPSFAIEAQSLMDNGYDSWGVPWPNYFQAYGEYKAPGLIYSYLPLIYLFGHTNTFISRLPSALLGLATLWVTFLILRLLYPRLSHFTASLLILILAFAPWFFGTSRVYFETNGGLFFIVLGFYGLLKYFYTQKNAFLILSTATLAISGYWYASYRYISLLILGVFLLISARSLRTLLSRMLLIVVVYLVVASGWIYYFVSSEGLKRLSHYQEITRFGATLVVDEKRAYCFLSFDRNPETTKICYALWNKPVEKINAVATTFLRYLSPEFLFFDSNQEYGVDIDYGAYHYLALIFYLLGIYVLLRSLNPTVLSFLKGARLSPWQQSILLLLTLTVAGFTTASLTEQVNLHRAMVGLWGIYLVIALGHIHFLSWVKHHPYRRVLSLATIIYVFVFAFYILQSQVNYFFVYTRSNDSAWRSDMGHLYQKIGELAPAYDRIIDTAYMGPLDASFYGLLPTSALATAERTPRNPEGWSYIAKAGKFEKSGLDLRHFVCEKIKTPSPTKTLVLAAANPEFSEAAIYSTRSWDGVHAMHDLYDLDSLIAYQIKRGINLNTQCK